VVLRKPSEYFKKDIVTVNNSVQELAKNPELNTFSDAFEAFKNNLSKIEVLSEFSDTLDNYRVNIERVNHLSKSVEDIQTEIQTLLKKEDLDRAMMSQLLVVEQSILDVQSKVKGINENKLTEICLDVSGLTQSVNEFLEVEVPQYKRLIVDSELRTNNRYEDLEKNVNQTLEGIGEFVDNKYQELTETLQGINEQSLSGILEDFKLLDENFAKLKEEEIPKYKGFIVETERKTEKKLEDSERKTESKLEDLTVQVSSQLSEFQENVDEKISTIQTSLKEFVEIEAPKYNKLLIENKLKTEAEVKEIQKNIEEKVSQFVEDIKTLKSDALTESKEVDKFVTEKINDFKKVLTETQKDVKKTLSTYNSISKTFESKVVSDNEKLNLYDTTLKDFSTKISECLSQVLVFKEEIEINEEIQNEWKEKLKEEFVGRFQEYQNELSEEFENVQSNLSKKVSDLEIEIVRNESHIKVQNKNLEQIQEDVKSAIQRLNLEELEEKNYELSKKVKYLEEVFEKFNEKEILTENIIVEPPSTDNKDPLTPLDQNFVTLDQLQQHYRLFINRIQQQLATIGGGGETRLEFLDDVDRNSAKVDGRFLKYDAASGKWIGAVGGGGGSQTLDDTLGLGNTSSLGMSVGVITATYFVGDGSLLTNISSSSNSGYATSAGIATYASSAGIATYASSAGISTYATNAGIATYATNAGIATYASSAGIATYADNAGIATYATNAGIATYATNAGISTYASSAGIATYATSAGIATYATSSGIATVAQGLTGTPNINVGIVTATSYNGSGINLTGIVTSIAAGSGISVDQSTGNVTITATGGGAISIKDEGSILGTAVTSINFVGSGVIATGDNSEVTVTIDGGVGIATAGGTVGTGVTLFDFRGPGISTVTVSSGIGTINITGGTVTSSLTIGTRTTAQTINLVGVGATILLRSGIGTLNF
jgi:hypothetical protein